MRHTQMKLEPFARKLSDRRESLGISQSTLARMAGLSVPTVQRVFTGNKKASLEAVTKIADALGLSISFNDKKKAEDILVDRARVKAKELAKIVQGTSALESQGLDKDNLSSIESNIILDLLQGSRSRLWSD